MVKGFRFGQTLMCTGTEQSTMHMHDVRVEQHMSVWSSRTAFHFRYDMWKTSLHRCCGGHVPFCDVVSINMVEQMPGANVRTTSLFSETTCNLLSTVIAFKHQSFLCAENASDFDLFFFAYSDPDARHVKLEHVLTHSHTDTHPIACASVH